MRILKLLSAGRRRHFAACSTTLVFASLLCRPVSADELSAPAASGKAVEATSPKPGPDGQSPQKAPAATKEAAKGAAPGDVKKSEKTTEKKTVKTDGKRKPVERRLVTVAGGQIALDSRHWPLIGNPDAKYIVVEMFDYTCPYCQATHQAVRGAIEHYGDDLAIIALPVPLDAACNRTVQYTASQHAEACEIARTAVAVWRCSRRQFAPFHDWLFEPAQRRTAAEARQHAAELVGEKAIADELSRPYSGQYLTKHVELYERVGSGSLPKLLFPRSTTSGSVESSSALIDIIGREFAQAP